MMPKRIQRKRAKGWKLPENTICVGRGTRWGNPFKIGHADVDLRYFNKSRGLPAPFNHPLTRAEVLSNWYINLLRGNLSYTLEDIRRELKGKDLACWCSLQDRSGHPVPCHADTMLREANK